MKSLGKDAFKYKWLITYIQAYPQEGKEFYKLINENDYLIFTTEEFINLLEKEDFQWAFAVFSGIPIEYSSEEILQYELPFADGNYNIYTKYPVIQHPLAEIEIVAHDAMFFQVTAKDEKILNNLKEKYFNMHEEYMNFFNWLVSYDRKENNVYFEFQYCKMNKPIKSFFGKDKFKNISFNKEDSLYVDMESFEELTDVFSCFLETYPFNKNVKFNKCGVNYYSKEMVIKFIQIIKRETNYKDNVLVSWLERAVNEYNGFYILGI